MAVTSVTMILDEPMWFTSPTRELLYRTPSADGFLTTAMTLACTRSDSQRASDRTPSADAIAFRYSLWRPEERDDADMHASLTLYSFVSFRPYLYRESRAPELPTSATGRLLGKGDTSLQSPIAAPTPSCSFHLIDVSHFDFKCRS